MGFSRQEYWSGLPCPPLGESSQPRDWTWVFCTAGRFFTDWATREAPIIISIIIIIKGRRRRGRRRKKGKRRRRSRRRRSKGRSISSNLYWESTGWGNKLKGNPQRKGRSKKEAVRDPVDVEWGDKIVPFSANLFRSKLFSCKYLWRSISFHHQFSAVAQSCLTLCNLMTAARQASLSITHSWSLLKLVSTSSASKWIWNQMAANNFCHFMQMGFLGRFQYSESLLLEFSN